MKLFQRTDSRARKTTIVHPVEQKLQSQKVRQKKMKEEYIPNEGRNISQMKEQDKTPEEQLNKVEIGNMLKNNSE